MRIVPRDETAPSIARELVAEMIGSATDEVALMVSEIVTNAVRHGTPSDPDLVELRAMLCGSRLRFETISPGPFHRPVAGEDRIGGFGLLLVGRLSDSWGVDRLESGNTRVWFSLEMAV